MHSERQEHVKRGVQLVRATLDTEQRTEEQDRELKYFESGARKHAVRHRLQAFKFLEVDG